MTLRRLIASATFWVIVALAFCSNAAPVTFTMTNSIGQADTNAIRLTQVNPHANADGSFQSVGVPFRITPNASGFVQTNLPSGTWLASNAFIVSTFSQPGAGGSLQGVLFNVDNTQNTNPFTRYLRSGYNIYNWYLGITGIGGTNGFIIQTNGDGTITLDGSGFAPTVPQITNALGFLPLTPQQTTNLGISLTNGYTAIVFSNQAVYMHTNLLPALTNKFATTNYAVGVSNSLYALIQAGGASQTNGYTTIVFSNSAVYINTNQIAAVTNRHLLTNDTRAINLSNPLNTVSNLTAAIITNSQIVFKDGSIGGFWLLRTNGGGLMISDTTDGGQFLFGTDGSFNLTGTLTANEIGRAHV